MKNTFRQLAAAVIAAAALFSMAACGDPSRAATTYTVTFHANGGSGAVPSPMTVQIGSSITLPNEGGLSRVGYAFGGWSNNADGTGSSYAIGASYTPAVSLTLYAKWIGSSTETNPIPLTVNVWEDGLISSSAVGSAAWYSFTVASGTTYYVWWNDGDEGSGKTLDVKVSAYYGSGSSAFEGADSGWAAPRSFSASSSGTVKIKVEAYSGGGTGTFAVAYSTSNTRPGAAAATYTVTFSANGGSGTPPAAQTVSAGSSITLPAGVGLSRGGYVFGGWNTQVDGNGTNRAAGASYTVSGSVTLYAQWNAVSTGPVSVDMVRVPGGSFEMGTASGGDNDERPVHAVTLTGFYMGKYEVTQGQYRAVMGSNPSYFTGDNLPVESVTWYEAVAFCNALSEREGLAKAYTISGTNVTQNTSATGYRLPTEAEWEYAARGGNGSPGNYAYSGSNTVGDVAWYSGNSNSRTHEVGTKAPNGLGLYDMSGNVWEWCWDWYGSYTSGAQTDPAGASSGSNRV